ncbi:MAG: hypothetical protein AMDU4_FER2C00005G0003 [Ferroplasma sp. Type II]|jgi:hypothetical protein|nr:MAG: hypothetical protein AMDU4_FER2C00005G0003 [Ferroplasma sp. Type II]
MALYTIFWIIIKYLVPVAILTYSVIKFNPFLIMISVLWLLVSLIVSLINFSIKSNFVKS